MKVYGVNRDKIRQIGKVNSKQFNVQTENAVPFEFQQPVNLSAICNANKANLICSVVSIE